MNTMNDILGYVSISHKTATTNQREKYHLSENDKTQLMHLICSRCEAVSGLFILATCNRTEIYFEASCATSEMVMDLFIEFKCLENKCSERKIFVSSDTTKSTLTHLLHVSSGLESLVFGDAEIISQIKKAHQFSMHHKMQGSLLERALQTVFKTHKRISNETNFRDGTTSVAYKALKVVRDTFGNDDVKSKKILFVGAGEIVKQLFEYNSKFKFKNIYVSNRSSEKAVNLAEFNSCNTYPWESVLSNNLGDFDVVISAVSNCTNLISDLRVSKRTLLIDLAAPHNINKALAETKAIDFYDLDAISVEVEETKTERLAAAENVTVIINEEIDAYKTWLANAAYRAKLSKFKDQVVNAVQIQLDTTETDAVKLITNQVMKKVAVQKDWSKTYGNLNHLISQEILTLHM